MMRFLDIPINLIKLLLCFILIATTSLGYGLIAAQALTMLKWAQDPVIKGIALSLLIAIGLYFCLQTSTILLTPNQSLPLQSQGYELYPHQRAHTFLICGIVGWFVILLMSPAQQIYLWPVLLSIAFILSGLQIIIAQFLSGGRLFDLLFCAVEKKEASSFSLFNFIDSYIFCYAHRKYLNLQIASAIITQLLILEFLPTSTINEGYIAVLEYMLHSWALAARLLIAFGFVLPCVYYCYSYSPFLVWLRGFLNWQAPSFLLIFYATGLFISCYHVSWDGQIESLKEAFFKTGLNMSAMLLCISVLPFAKRLSFSRQSTQKIRSSDSTQLSESPPGLALEY